MSRGLRRLGATPMNPAEIHLWCWLSTDAEMRAVAQNANTFLDGAEQGRALRFVRTRDCWRFQASRIFLRSVLARYAGISPADLPIRLAVGGKPQLCPSVGSDLTFNLSHSECNLVLAVSRRVSLGVDVEVRPSGDVVETLSRRYFAPQECRQMAHLSGEDRIALFQAYWTLKEAYGKALGTGLRDGLSVSFQLRGTEGRISGQGSDGELDPNWRFAQYRPGQSLCLAVAWDGSVSHSSIRPFRVRAETGNYAPRSLSNSDVEFSFSHFDLPNYHDRRVVSQSMS